MRYRFNVTDEGLVNVTLHDDLPLMKEALEDSLGTRPPKGAPQDGPSTYWLDNAIGRLRERMQSGNPEPFASGNVTCLQLRGRKVEARYEFDPEESAVVDVVPVNEFLSLLQDWRQRVLQASSDADRRLPPPRIARPMPPA